MKTIHVKEPIEVSAESFDKLVDFLISREDDIAEEIEDFGELQGIFRDIFDEEAKVEK